MKIGEKEEEKIDMILSSVRHSSSFFFSHAFERIVHGQMNKSIFVSITINSSTSKIIWLDSSSNNRRIVFFSRSKDTRTIVDDDNRNDHDEIHLKNDPFNIFRYARLCS